MKKMRNLMIRASAGTGKTYQLSNRFLALLAEGAPASRLIALTFTKKAAAEFAQRILLRLAGGALGEQEAGKLAGELEATLEGLGNRVKSEELGVERLRALLEDLVANLHRISLTTLDSFFVRIVKHFPYELGVSELRILDTEEQRRLRMESMQQTFRELSAEQRGMLSVIFREIQMGKSVTRVREAMLELFSEFHDLYLEHSERELWGNEGVFEDVVDEDGWKIHFEDLATFSFASEAGGMIEGLWEDLMKVNEDGEPVKKGKKRKVENGHFLKWAKSVVTMVENFAAYVPNQKDWKFSGIEEKILRNLEAVREGRFVDRYQTLDCEIPIGVQKGLYRLCRAYFLSEMQIRTQQTQSLYALMTVFDQNYRKRVRDLGLLTFADVTRLLRKGGLGGEGGLRMESRLDAEYEHWMLDEFQDTSRGQMGILRNLLDEAVFDEDGRRSLFVVGDVKQSIYGWRGGDSRLFDELYVQGKWSERMGELAMQTSYRSSASVLHLSNEFFGEKNAYLERLGEVGGEARKRFGYLEHEAARGEMVGYSSVWVLEREFVRKEDDIGLAESNFSDQVEAMEKILREVRPLERGLSCAILVRKNQDAMKIADGLRGLMPWLPVEVEANTMIAADQPLGVALMDLFRWLNMPRNGFARRHVMATPLRKWLEQWGSREDVQWEKAREFWVERGAGGVLDACFGLLREESEWMSDFLWYRADALLRLGYEFDEEGSVDLEKWILRMESALQRDRATAGAIQVMTIHKSKGLEFDCVMVADLGGDAFDAPHKASMLALRNPATQEVDLLLRPPRKILLECDPMLRARYEEWRSDAFLEGMCNLYVAFTRAKYASYVIATPVAEAYVTNQKKAGARIGLGYREWIYHTFCQQSGGGSEVKEESRAKTWEDLVVFEDGAANWFEAFDLASEEEESGEVSREKLLLKKPKLRVKRATPSREKTKKATASQHSRGGMAFGTEVHALFERVGWVDESAPCFAGNSPAEKLVLRLLEKSDIRGFFEKKGREVRLFREQGLEVMQDGRWMSGVMDRLHVFADESGAVVRCELIDFKTDSVGGGEELREKYAGQMRAYVQALRGIYPSARCEAFLLSTKLEKMVAMELEA